MGKETYYKRKRKKAGLAQSDMAKELGIDYKKYNLIENGVVKMPSKLIDKFNEIVNRGENNHKLERLTNEQIVNDFWEEMRTKVGKQYKLKEKMQEFNIVSFKNLADLLDISGSNLSHYLNSDWTVPYDFKNRLYLFFQDELNIQVPKKSEAGKGKNDARRSNKQCHNPELIEFYNNLDLETFCKEHNTTYRELSRELGLHQDSIRRMVSKETSMPSEKTLRKIKNYMESLEEQPNVAVEFQEFIADAVEKCDEEPTEHIEKCDEEDIKRRYRQEIEENNVVIETYQDIINNLLNRNRVCEEVLKVIDELRGE